MSVIPFHKRHNRQREQSVNDFLIWRAAQSAGWDCTTQDIADDTGLHVRTVQAACKRRGWSQRLVPNPNTGHPDRYDVDVAMRSGERFA